MFTRSRLALLAAALIALASVLALSACGGDDEETVQTTLDEAFTQPIGSADVALNVDLQLEGSEQFTEPIQVQLSGPFRSAEADQLPQFDWDLGLSGTGETQIPPIGLISTGDNFFVDVQGSAYEAGEDIVSQALAQQPEEEQQGLAALGIDPREWIVDGQDEGQEDVAGVTTNHVSGSVDVPRLLADLNEVAQSAESPVAGQPTPTLTEEQIAQVEEVVGDPTFDVFVGADDGILRRMTANMDFTVPEELQAQATGLTGGSLDLSIEFANVGGDQEITAPTDARPLSDLAEQFGGLVPGGAGQIPGLPAPDGGGGGAAPSPDGGQLPGGEQPGGGQAPGGASSPEAQQFQEYGECLQDADPQDQAALQECNELLAPGGGQ